MSKSRSTSSTSGRGSQSSTTRGSTARTTTPDQDLVGTPTGLPGASADVQPGGFGTEQSTMEKAQQLAGQVQQKATQRVESGLARGKTQAAETLNTVAESLIISGQQLRERNQENVSRYVDQAADRVRRVSSYLRNTDVSEIVDRTEEFARRRPALFLGGAFALGLLGARFLKSSNRQGGGMRAEGGGWSGRGYSRQRTAGIEQEVPTSRPQQEWAASGGVPASEGFADLPRSGIQTQPLGESGFGRQSTFDLDAPGGPEASQR